MPIEPSEFSSHTSDPEMDMNRRRGAAANGRMRRFLSLLLGSALRIEAPRRSVDREQQEHSPSSY
jgi:hypothetical protein